jgi:hypothetical protein
MRRRRAGSERGGGAAAMKSRLAVAAAKRLDEHRTLQTGTLATAQKTLWEALLAGNIEEALRQADIVERR